MHVQRWDRLKDIFTAAAVLSPEDIDAFLTETCGGDVELRREAERLLAHAHQSDSFLETPLVALPHAGLEDEDSLREGDFIADRFVIEQLIGSGGMGEVYRALDQRLNRTVAIKVLGMQKTIGLEHRQRLIREARAVARLSHPNICSLYHFDSTREFDYLVFEYLEGETLTSRLHRGCLSQNELYRLAREISGALAYAHSCGLIHRDLKPSNIMLTPKGAKLVDFGLARSMEDLLDTRSTVVTQQGAIVGSVSYMSPEQAQGNEVDARTDIFSFGAVLYECVTARKAFAESSAISTLVAVSNNEPPRVQTLAPETPEALCALIHKCLCKQPGDRFQTMSEVEAALDTPSVSIGRGTGIEPTRIQTEAARRWSRVRYGRTVLTAVAVAMVLLALPAIRLFDRTDTPSDSLAVLPFTNSSKSPELDYLVDGMAESVTNALARIPELRVIARTTAQRYKGDAVDVQRIGNTLNVSAILTGNVSTTPTGLIRVQTDLIDVSTGAQLWGKQYQGTVRDALHIEEDVASSVVDRLNIAATKNGRNVLIGNATKRAEAHVSYLRGRHALNAYTEETLKVSIEHFTAAIALDPTYAVAYAGLADAYTGLSSIYLEPAQAMERAKAAVRRALELDPDLAEAATAMGLIRLFYDYDHSGAERDLIRALQLRPNDAWTHLWLGWTLTIRGRLQDGIREAKRAHELDPLSAFVETGLGQMYYFDGQHEAAVRQLRNVVALNAQFVPGHLWLGVAYLNQKQYPLAIRALESARSLDSGLPSTVAYLSYAFAKNGSPKEALEMLRRLETIGTQRYVPPYLFAIAQTGLGDYEAAVRSLEEGFQKRDDMLITLKIDALLAPLRSDARFAALVKRCRL